MKGVSGYAELLFWLFAAVAVIPGAAILIARDIVRQAFWLLASLSGFAGLYLWLGADFLGFTQVIVYIGGILILFLFGVMLTQKADVPLKEEPGWDRVFPGVLAGALFVTASLGHLESLRLLKISALVSVGAIAAAVVSVILPRRR